MLYNGRWTPPHYWPSLIRHPSYYADRRLSSLWFLILATIALALSITALIIVFAVEHSWFHDSFNGTTSVVRYGLWRVCFNESRICDSWFVTTGPLSILIDQRLNTSRAGINAWQALEIIFLFLTTATFIIAVASIVCYRLRNSLHYYSAVLAAFCVWLAASIGVCTLFVFGFAVFNTSQAPRELDWCFYLNLVAVILAVLAAVLLSIYDCLLKKPIKTVDDDDAVIETFADLNGNPAALSPSTFVVVRRNKYKRNGPYDYPQILYPNHYQPPKTATASNEFTRTEYLTNTNQHILAPYTTKTTIQETTTTNQQALSASTPPPPPPPPPLASKSQSQTLTSYRNFDYNPSSNLVTSQSIATTLPQTQPFRPALSAYPYQPRSSPVHWHRTGTNVLNRSIGYASEPTHDYLQRDYYPYPIRTNFVEQKREPRILHYYTGYDYFATIDPSDLVATRYHGPGTAVRYSGNSSYNQPSDYITSTM